MENSERSLFKSEGHTERLIVFSDTMWNDVILDLTLPVDIHQAIVKSIRDAEKLAKKEGCVKAVIAIEGIEENL